MKKQKGFTIIELLVVIAIIAVLASIVLVSVNNVREKAKIVQVLANMKQIDTALKMYYNDYGTCPCYSHCFDGICDPWTENVSCLKNALQPYLSSFPSSDPWGMSWRYHCHPGGGFAGECTCFFSSGPDKSMQSWPWGNCAFSGDDIGRCQGQPGDLGY